MKRTLEVFIGERPRLVGRLHHDSHGRRESSAFEYDSSWLDGELPYTIDPALQLVRGPQFPPHPTAARIFHGAIADTEPDGWGRRVILRDHAKQRQLSRGAERLAPPPALTAIDFLLAVDDRSRVGALRLRDESGEFQRAEQPGRRTTPPIVELPALLAATRAVETNSETAADLEYLRGRGTSLGGLRPKCSVVDDSGQLAIGKFPSVHDDRPVTQGEVLALRLARKAGIDAAAARLVSSDGVPVALISRFDRSPDGGRVAYLSAGTLLGVPPDDPADHAYTEVVDAIRVHGAAPKADIQELWRRICFSILITNVDDHLWNHGFLHAGEGRWRLAPAFDVNPFPGRVRELKTWLSESAGPEATMEGLLSTARYFRVSQADARNIVASVESAVATWRDEGRVLGLTENQLDQFADAFEHPERAAARRVAG